MNTTELIQRVRRIEIKSRQLSSNVLSGEYQSSFQGRGMAFSEVRPYQIGDDIRSIDWNVTARKQQPFIKVFEEERERTVILLMDVSPSGYFGSTHQRKSDLAIEVAATLAFSAIQNNDKVGVIFFSDQVEKYIPPRKGRQHILTIISELIQIKPEGRGTDIQKALEYLNGIHKRRSIAMLISDFADLEYKNTLRVTARKHDLIGIHISDPAEWDMPSLGVVSIRDSESGKLSWVNTSSKKRKRLQKEQMQKYHDYFSRTFKASGAGAVELKTGNDFVPALLTYFKTHHQR